MSILQNLYDRLQNSGTSASSISLDAGTLPPGEGNPDTLLAQLRGVFQTDALEINLTGGFENKEPLSFQGTANLLGVAMKVEGTFSLSGDSQPELRLQLKAIPPKPEGTEGWYFSHSFPEYVGSYLDQLNLLNPFFYFSSYADPSSPEVFFPLQKGLHFQSDLAIDKELRPLTEDTSPDNVIEIRIGGFMDTSKAPPEFEFHADRGDLSGIIAGIPGADLLPIRDGNISFTAYQAYISGKMTALGQELDLSLGFPLQTRDAYIQLLCPGPIPVPGMGEIIRLMGGDELANYIPDSFLSIPNLEVSHIEFQFNPAAHRETYGTVRLAPAQGVTGWVLFSNPEIRIKNLGLELNSSTIQYGENQILRVMGGRLQGSVAIDNTLEVYAELSTVNFDEALLYLEQYSERPNIQDLAGLMGTSDSVILEALPEAIRSFPAISIRYIELGVQLLQPTGINHVSFQIAQTEPWNIIDTILTVDSWSLDFLLTKEGNGWLKSGKLAGAIALGNLLLWIEIPIPLSETAILEIQEPVELPDLEDFTSLLGGQSLTSLLPETLTSVGGFYLNNFRIEASLSPAHLNLVTFALDSYTDWVIIENRLVLSNIHMDFNVLNPLQSERSLTGTISGTLQIGSTQVYASAIRAASAEWAIGVEIDVIPLPSFSEMTSLLGNDDFDSIASLLPASLKNGHIDILNLDIQAFAGQTNRLKGIQFALRTGYGRDVSSGSARGADFEFSAIAIDETNPDSGWKIEVATGPGMALKIADMLKAGQSVLLDVPAGKYLEEIISSAASLLPGAVTEFTIRQLKASYNTATKDFGFSCAGELPLGANPDSKVQAVLEFKRTGQNGAYQLSGRVRFNERELDMVFSKKPQAKTFALLYQGGNDNIDLIGDLVGKFSPDLFGDNPPSLDLNFKQVVFAYVKTGEKGKYALGLKLGAHFSIAQLPLVGDKIPARYDAGIEDLQLVLASEELTAAELSEINGAIETAGGQSLVAVPPKQLEQASNGALSPKVLDKGLNFSGKLNLAGDIRPLLLPLGGGQAPPTAASENIQALGTATPAFIPAGPADVKWLKVQKKLGPLFFEKIGFRYHAETGKRPTVSFLLNAALVTEGLTISLDGASISSPLPRMVDEGILGVSLEGFDPSFGLRGIGLDYKKGPLEIGAAFLNRTPPPPGFAFEFDGLAIIRTEKLAISAIGSYAQSNDGHPSLFLYAVLDPPLGGPAFFFVMGLALGFGYNRRLNVPGIDGVRNFPLVQMALDGPPGGDGQGDVLTQVLERLGDAVPPDIGQYFLAVGIKFSSFKLLDGFVLLTLGFGEEFQLDLLGVLSFIHPPQETGAPPVANVQIAMKASYDQGAVKVDGKFVPGSYILSRDCHLFGSLAFYTWFQGEHAGDFVLSLGGYHPSFVKPAHYPTVPRLGFLWRVDSHTTVKGEAYFALTPSMVMAGGKLEANWHSGNFKAWFIVGADLLISWKPVHYDFRAYVSIGASYTFHFFGTHTISGHMSAQLHIWGPPFAGTARVDLSIVSFTVSFGQHGLPGTPPLLWDEFRTSFLPRKEGASGDSLNDYQITAVTATGGLVKEIGKGENAVWQINPRHFSLSTDSAIPITKVELRWAEGSAPIPVKVVDGGQVHEFALTKAGPDAPCGLDVGDYAPINLPEVKPMGVSGEFESIHSIQLTKDSGGRLCNIKFVPIRKNVPGAVWGHPKLNSYGNLEIPARANAEMVRDTLGGFELKPAKPPESQHTESFDSSLLAGIPTGEIRDVFRWSENWQLLPQNSLELEELGFELVTGKKQVRKELLNSLGFEAELDGSLSNLRNQNYIHFVAKPGVVTVL